MKNLRDIIHKYIKKNILNKSYCNNNEKYYVSYRVNFGYIFKFLKLMLSLNESIIFSCCLKSFIYNDE